jgi:hypothetical protein
MRQARSCRRCQAFPAHPMRTSLRPLLPATYLRGRYSQRADRVDRPVEPAGRGRPRQPCHRRATTDSSWTTRLPYGQPTDAHGRPRLGRWTPRKPEPRVVSLRSPAAPVDHRALKASTPRPHDRAHRTSDAQRHRLSPRIGKRAQSGLRHGRPTTAPTRFRSRFGLRNGHDEALAGAGVR